MYTTNDSREWMAEAKRRGLEIDSDDGTPESGPRMGGPTVMWAIGEEPWQGGSFDLFGYDWGYLYDEPSEWERMMQASMEPPSVEDV